MDGLPEMPVQKGQVEYYDRSNPSVGVRILTEGTTPMGKFVYLRAGGGQFWPRVTDPADVVVTIDDGDMVTAVV